MMSVTASAGDADATTVAATKSCRNFRTNFTAKPIPIPRPSKPPFRASAVLIEPEALAFNRRRPGRTAQLTTSAALAQ
jgi:hypothetical protein